MVSSFHLSLRVLLSHLIFPLLIIPYPAFSSQITCNSKSLISTKNTTYSYNNYRNCKNLATLNAVLEWTYNPTNSSYSMAVTATAPSPNGWVGFGLNPRAPDMKGAQALIAFKPNGPASPVSVNTYNIQSPKAIIKGPISYNVTGLSAQESDGQITIFATWALPEGVSTVNMIWQVGPVHDRRPQKHELEQPNLESKMKLDLLADDVTIALGGPTPAPVNGAVVIGKSSSSISITIVVGLVSCVVLLAIPRQVFVIIIQYTVDSP